MIKSIQNFMTIDYLASGAHKQKDTYRIIKELHILEVLESYHPILVGTIPIEVDLPESDLDIICEVYDFDNFRDLMSSTYGKYEDFNCRIRSVEGMKRVVCNFTYKGWLFEVFGQSLPTDEQNGYRHMIIEHRILNVLGDKSKEFIIDLKSRGLKTEPAFGELLQIQSDPYKYLLEMYDWEDEELIDYLSATKI